MKIDQLKRFENFWLISSAVLLIFLYCYGALEHSRIINLDPNRVDQAAYLSYARNLYEANYNYVGGRNRMPVYPLLLSLIYSSEFTKAEFYTKFFTWGKYFNIALTAALLPSIFWLLKKNFPLIQAINLWLITTFTVFIFRAGYVQAELLFYFLNFCCFLLMYAMFKKPSWRLGILTGAVLGITHLTKASITPGFVLFVAFFLAKEIYSLYVYLKTDSASQLAQLNQIKQKFASNLLSIALVVLTFLGIVYPYISTSQRFFGQYFYNVNSTLYIWYDSWEQAEQGTRLHGDGKGWPEMPPQRVPSFRKYLREHTAQQILNRFLKGINKVFSVASHSYGYFKYIVIFLGASLFMSILNFRKSLSTFRQNLFLISFSITYFLVYLLLYAWYTPIASGNRYTLSQFIPLMFFLAAILKVQFGDRPYFQLLKFKIQWFYLFNLLILGMILFEIPDILTYRIVTMFAGT